ncbi:hypothetical protein BRADI_3g09592v3 [Brachypodium distachyon]|uniref:Uncharacterized protein n=1 Tax=Brachypodium distachyon TaxID=15368 RepID=A0A2K2CW85_BRADI|nr:hypothetical protein BRADI_3g09592v3 [Brachypodium distachyon]
MASSLSSTTLRFPCSSVYLFSPILAIGCTTVLVVFPEVGHHSVSHTGCAFIHLRSMSPRLPSTSLTCSCHCCLSTLPRVFSYYSSCDLAITRRGHHTLCLHF